MPEHIYKNYTQSHERSEGYEIFYSLKAQPDKNEAEQGSDNKRRNEGQGGIRPANKEA